MAQGLQFYPLTPCRVVDTRNASGPFRGPSLSAQRASTGSGTQTYLMAIPTGVPLNLWLHSIYVTMADSAGNALPASGAKIPFTAAAGSNSSFTINVTGPISATAPAGLQ